MEELFKVIDLSDKEKIGVMVAEAHSKVKSTKEFPLYMIDGKKMIYKPLSKTKPLTTPFFAYSEIYWSYIINKYFDEKAPRYYLAETKKKDDEKSKYYNKGVLVESLTPNNEKLINLYDYFNEHPDKKVDIKDYINYCMMNYDYTMILESDFIKNNKEIGEGLAYQILLSVLREDQNFHYENINFTFKNNILILEPPIDFEFSTPFLYPDDEKQYEYERNKYFNSVKIDYEKDEIRELLKKIALEKGFSLDSKITKNICLIVKMYPDIVLKFIKNLDRLIEDLDNISITDPDNYISSLNSDYWKVGHALYKDNNLEEYERLKKEISLVNINKEAIFKRISNDILEFSKHYALTLKTYLISYYEGIDNLEDLTIKDLLTKLGITDDVVISDIDIDSKKLKLSKRIVGE